MQSCQQSSPLANCQADACSLLSAEHQLPHWELAAGTAVDQGSTLSSTMGFWLSSFCKWLSFLSPR